MSLMVLGFVACSSEDSYGVDASMRPKQQPAPKDTTKQDSVPVDKKEWNTPVKRYLSPIGEPSATSHKWEGTNIFYCGSDSLVKKANQTVEYGLFPATGFSSAKTNQPAEFMELSTTTSNSQNTTYGEYYEDENASRVRPVTMLIDVKTSEFSKTLKMTRRDGYCIVNGKSHAFKAHTMQATFKSLSVIDSVEVERNDSLFMRKTYEVAVNATFIGGSKINQRTYVCVATHTVENFVGLVEKEKEEKATSNWNFVQASLVYNPDASVNGGKGAFHVCIVAKNSIDKKWLVAITKTFGNPKAADFDKFEYSFSEYKENSKINSALRWQGKWLPANLKINGKEWSYGYSTDIYVNMGMSLAETCGIKNFKGSNTAENSPILNFGKHVAEDGSLVITNHLGVEVLRIK